MCNDLFVVIFSWRYFVWNRKVEREYTRACYCFLLFYVILCFCFKIFTAVKLRNFDERFKKKNAISRRLILVRFPKTANVTDCFRTQERIVCKLKRYASRLINCVCVDDLQVVFWQQLWENLWLKKQEKFSPNGKNSLAQRSKTLRKMLRKIIVPVRSFMFF